MSYILLCIHLTIIVKYRSQDVGTMKDGKVNRFKVDENGFTVDGYRVLNPLCLRSMYLSRAIGIVILAAVFYLMYVGIPELKWAGTWLAAIFIILLIYSAVGPFIFYKRYRYRMDEDKIEVRRGILYITHLLVPVERVHQVDVKVGPINRIFGLADVGITTAGGAVSLQFLEEDVAEGIATTLNDKIVCMLKERV